MKEDSYFRDYTPEQCQQDLNALVSWGNLITMQDTRKVSTIEEFKNKKFRYQLSEATVEIERMVIRVENLFIESSSLEPTLLERIRINLGKIPEMQNKDREKIYTWWNDLNNDYIRLNQNYQDYMRELSSVKAEHHILYYSGDFDPEGLLIARDIKIRYGEKAVLWNYKSELYEKYVSEIVLDESRLKKLEKIKTDELQEIKNSCFLESARHIRRQCWGSIIWSQNLHKNISAPS